jgi:hypothetical protein
VIFVLKPGSLFSLLCCINKLSRPVSSAREEEEDEYELYPVPLGGEGRSITSPIEVK